MTCIALFLHRHLHLTLNLHPASSTGIRWEVWPACNNVLNRFILPVHYSHVNVTFSVQHASFQPLPLCTIRRLVKWFCYHRTQRAITWTSEFNLVWHVRAAINSRVIVQLHLWCILKEGSTWELHPETRLKFPAIIYQVRHHSTTRMTTAGQAIIF